MPTANCWAPDAVGSGGPRGAAGGGAGDARTGHGGPRSRRPGRWASTLALLALVLWNGASRPASAEEPSRLQQARPDTLRLSPRAVLWRSAVFPGWGQLRNGHRLRALAFAAGAAGMLTWTVAVQQDLRSTADRIDGLATLNPFDGRLAGLRQRQQDLAARRNTRVLSLVAIATVAALDAYVDAHLADLDRAGVRLALRVAPPGAALTVSGR